MKTRKFTFITSFILIMTLLISAVQFPAFASGEPYIVEQGGFVYEVYTDGSNELHSVFVTKYNGSSTEIEMPRPKSLVINGKTYPAIAGTSFVVGNGTDPVFSSNTVTKVAIPSGYEAISADAFNGCTSLTEVAIAGSVGYIGVNAFNRCTNLVNYYIEGNPSLSTDNMYNPRIAQSGSKLNFKQATVYTKSTNNNITSYVGDINALFSSSGQKILIQYENDPYSKSGVTPGSGITGGGSAPSTPAAPTKGKDGTAIGQGASESVANAFLVKYSSESDPAGSKFSALQLKSSKVTKNSVKLSWKKPSGAVRFVIYGNKCGKANKYVKQATTKATSATIKKIGSTKIKKGTYYKFIVVAYDNKGKVVSTSKTVHAATTGGKVGNAKSLTTKAKKNKASVKKGKTFKLAAKAKPASSKLMVKKHRAVLYESSNTKVATVSKKGVIKGVKKGTCYVYAYAQNGICAKIKVTVK
ncbi:MAG: leucine-rich repeat protein [Eubacterium sp.]|nr:leucine-rich repeat protein [Eubacterium sp.]